MVTGTNQASQQGRLANTNGRLLVAMPESSLSMTQDAEWCVVRIGDSWRQIRFHDYDSLFAVPGLYEKVMYDILLCNSPSVVRGLLETELAKAGVPVDTLRVLDFGAGNGMVAEELANMGAGFIVGVDISEQAADAARRDRPNVYDDYRVVDMAALKANEKLELAACRFNAMSCVAALGFGDIPTKAFISAYNLVEDDGWIAFNIKEDFLSHGDPSGFSGLIRRMIEDGTLELCERQRYRHRVATDRNPLHYVAIVGRKRRNVS